MKLAHLAQGLTIALLIVTAWLAWQAQQEAAISSAKIDKLTQQQRSLPAEASPSLIPGAQTPISMAPAPPPVTAAPTASITPATPSVDGVPPLPKPLPPLPAAGNPTPPPAPPTVGSAGSPAPAKSAPVAPAGPPPLTPLQRQVKNSPALGKVVEAVPEQGFVVLDTTAKQNVKAGMLFDLRRDAAIVGRVTVTAVEDTGTVANLDPKTVPAGIAVQAGDEVIAVINP